jgi:hypothetical protein
LGDLGGSKGIVLTKILTKQSERVSIGFIWLKDDEKYIIELGKHRFHNKDYIAIIYL